MVLSNAQKITYMLLRKVQNYATIISYTNWILWSAYHASVQEVTIPSNTLLPLLVDSVHSVAMIKHSLIHDHS